MMTSIIILIIYYYFYCTIYTYVNYTITLYYYYIHILRLLYYYNYYDYCNIAYYCFCTRDARKCALSKNAKNDYYNMRIVLTSNNNTTRIVYVHVGALYNNMRNKKKTA
jgi:hypothetical protein